MRAAERNYSPLALNFCFKVMRRVSALIQIPLCGITSPQNTNVFSGSSVSRERKRKSLFKVYSKTCIQLIPVIANFRAARCATKVEVTGDFITHAGPSRCAPRATIERRSHGETRYSRLRGEAGNGAASRNLPGGQKEVAEFLRVDSIPLPRSRTLSRRAEL